MWPAIMLGASVLSAYGEMRSADGAGDVAMSREEAAQMRLNAGQIVAAGQHAGEDALRESEMSMSRMIAVAAASGASAVDPTVVKLASGVAQEGHLAAATERANAESEAAGMRKQADMRVRSAYNQRSTARRAARWRAAGSILQGGYAAFGE